MTACRTNRLNDLGCSFRGQPAGEWIAAPSRSGESGRRERLSPAGWLPRDLIRAGWRVLRFWESDIKRIGQKKRREESGQ